MLLLFWGVLIAATAISNAIHFVAFVDLRLNRTASKKQPSSRQNNQKYLKKKKRVPNKNKNNNSNSKMGSSQ